MRESPPRSAISKAEHAVARVASTRPFDRAARLGLMCRGVLHLVVGGVALRLGLGTSPRAIGWKESIAAVASVGRTSLLVMLAGLVGYGVWRVGQAIADTERKGRSAYGLVTRLGFALDGLGYVGLAVVGAQLAMGRGVDVREHTADQVARFLPTTWGRAIVFLAGALMLVSAITHFVEVVRAKFADDFPRGELGHVTRALAIGLGRVGIAARGAVFALLAFFVGRAALHRDASEAKGLAALLDFFAEGPPTRGLLVAIGAGLLAYAMFCFVYARHRRIAPA